MIREHHRAKSVLLILLIAGMIAVPSIAQQAGAEKRPQLKVATYNLRNMTDVFDDPYVRDEKVGVKERSEITAIAKALRHIDADVVAVQEVENQHVLRAMVNELLPDMGYGFIAVEPTNTNHGQNLGVISRRPILSITSYRLSKLTLPDQQRTWRLARDILKVRIQATPDRVLSLYNVHFKSRRDSHNDPKSTRRRLAEASATRRIISDELTQNPKAWVLLVGDMNATLNSPAINLLLKIRPDGLPMLFDVHDGFAETDRITYLKEPYRGTIDYIFASGGMNSRLVSGSATVVRDESLLGGSDHAPVVATFDVGP